MNLQVLQEDFSKAINLASRFTSLRAQLPILANVLLSTSKNKLIISATNLEISINLSIGAKIEKEGQITVPARVLNEILVSLNPNPIRLISEKENLQILTPSFNSTLAGMNASDFPQIPQKLDKDRLKFKREALMDSLNQVLFAVSVDETRPVLTGVLFVFKKQNLELVATDGFRLSRKILALEKTDVAEKIILPKNILGEIVRLPAGQEEINFSFKKADNQAVFEIEGIYFSSRVIEGDFPDYEKIIPKSSKVKIRLDKEDFLQAIKLASVFARDSANVVKFLVKENELEVLAESSFSGSQKTTLAAKVEGEKMEIAFNFRFLQDFLQVVKGEEVLVELSGSNLPGVFLDPKDKDFLHLIMPVRID